MTTLLAPATRPATAADAALLRALFIASLPARTAALADVPGLLELQHDARERSYAAAYPTATDEIVLLGDAPAGRLLTAPTADGTHVVDVAVAPEHRGRGLGTALLERLLEAGPVSLRVAVDNPARGLYDRLGFTTTDDTTSSTDLLLHHPGRAKRARA